MHTKQFSEACEQNKEPILNILSEVFKDRKSVLEIASGTGQHAVFFADHLQHLIWHPSDLVENLPSIHAWRNEQSLKNLNEPVALNVMDSSWRVEPAVDAVFSANSLHIMSWEMVEHFFKGVGLVLKEGGKLLIYGPFSYEGVHTSPSNEQFNQYLKRRNPLSGIRDFHDVNTLATQHKFVFIEDFEMPVNNRCLLWEKQ